MVAALLEFAIDLAQEALQAAEQTQAATYLKQQAVAAPGVESRRDAVSPAAQLLQAAGLGRGVALQKLQALLATESPRRGDAHSRLQATGGCAVIQAQQSLPRHHGPWGIVIPAQALQSKPVES